MQTEHRQIGVTPDSPVAAQGMRLNSFHHGSWSLQMLLYIPSSGEACLQCQLVRPCGVLCVETLSHLRVKARAWANPPVSSWGALGRLNSTRWGGQASLSILDLRVSKGGQHQGLSLGVATVQVPHLVVGLHPQVVPAAEHHLGPSPRCWMVHCGSQGHRVPGLRSPSPTPCLQGFLEMGAVRLGEPHCPGSSGIRTGAYQGFAWVSMCMSHSLLWHVALGNAHLWASSGPYPGLAGASSRFSSWPGEPKTVIFRGPVDPG